MSTIRRLLFWFENRLGQFKLSKFQSPKQRFYCVLMYHGVEDDADKLSYRPLDMTRQSIINEIDFHLSQGYQACSQIDNSNSKTTAGPGLLVTFDDGNRNIADTIVELSERYQIQPLIAICPGVVENQCAFWFEEIFARLLLTNKQIEHPGITDRYTPANAFKQLMDYYFADKTLGSKELLMQIRDASSDVDEQQITGHPAVHQNLSWDELRDLVRHNRCIIAAHTMYHDSILHMNASELSNDLEACRQLIKLNLGVDCNQFVYPFGDSASAQENQWLKQAGFDYSYIVDEKINFDLDSNYRLCRTTGRNIGQAPGYYKYLWQQRHSS